jgi:hypothetical protein
VNEHKACRSRDHLENVVFVVPDVGAVRRVSRYDAAIGSSSIRLFVIAVDPETRASKHLIGRIGIQDDCRQSRMSRIDQSCHFIPALRQRPNVMLILHRWVIHAGAMSGIACEKALSIVIEGTSGLMISVHALLLSQP